MSQNFFQDESVKIILSQEYLDSYPKALQSTNKSNYDNNTQIKQNTFSNKQMSIQKNPIFQQKDLNNQSIEMYSQIEDKTIKKKYLQNFMKQKNSHQTSKKNVQSNQIKDIFQKQNQSILIDFCDISDSSIILSEQNIINQQNQDLQQNTQQTLNEIIYKPFSNLKHNYSNYEYLIYNELQKKNYTLISYLNSGGQADVFAGYFQNDQTVKQECVFKIYYDTTSQEFQKEIQIMKSFENPINIVKIIDSLQIQQFFILILEKCECSLRDELKLFKERKKIFTFEILLQIIFDLLDGLIQFRIYNILHLDIKPGNILKSKEGYYCYSDFGISFNIKQINEIQEIQFTKNYCPPEQLKKEKSANFQSDVYSLGKTLKIVIDTFKDSNKEYLLNQEKEEKLIKNFENIINQQMILLENNERKQCKNLHELFFKQLKVEQYHQFFSKYNNKLTNIIGLYEFDQNKDISYFLELRLQYCLIQLNLIQNQSLNFLINQDGIFVDKQQSGLQNYKNNLGQFEQSQITNQTLKGNFSISKSLINVGKCYQTLGDNQNGLKYHLESLEMRKQIFQGNHPNIAISLNNVGLCNLELGENQYGLKYLLESLEMTKQIFQGNHPHIASSLNNVGSCYQSLGDNQNGLKYLLESLEMDKQIFQGNHPVIARSLHNVGSCNLDLGENQNGLKFLLESLEMRKQIYQGNHPYIAISLNGVGLCYQSLGDNQNSLNYLLESLEMEKQIFQGNHPNIATLLNNVGQGYQSLGDNQNGLKYLLESLEMRKQIFQGNKFDIAYSLNNVGSCYQTLGDSQNCLSYLLESLEMIKQVFQGNHPDIAKILNNVGLFFTTLRESQYGLKYLLESLEMIKQVFQENHPLIATTLNNVAYCYLEIGDNNNALKYLLKLNKMKKQMFPNFTSSHNNMGLGFQIVEVDQNPMKYLQKSLNLGMQILSFINVIYILLISNMRNVLST